jgi:hypothetical protein
MQESAPKPLPPPDVVRNVVVQTGAGVPQTPTEVQAMRAQRTELSNQLNSALGRRDDIVDQLREASASERPGLEARLQVLDDRIVQLEQEIARTGELIAQAPGGLLQTGTVQIPNSNGISFRSVDTTAIAVIFTLFVLAPIAFTVARLIWKRGSAPPRPRLDTETQERMRRLESAVDTVAIEVERISEGQRFVTKLLAEREKQQLPR